MKTSNIIPIIVALILLGCLSLPALGGGEVPVITTSQNFTMKEGWQQNFKTISGNITLTHTLTVSHIEGGNAAEILVDSNQLILTPGTPRQVSLSGGTVYVTLDSISSGYATLIVSLSQPSKTGQQNQTSPSGATLNNGTACSDNSQCLSNHCSNGYCCASGSCCASDADCSVGSCNRTTYSCFSPNMLSNGVSCSSNSGCQSGHCSNGYCCNSGKCCASSLNCASGETCTASSCVQTASTYNAVDAETKANSTTDGLLMKRFSSLLNSARQCSGGSSDLKQCIPHVAVREDKISDSTYNVTYSYSFNGASCCPVLDVLTITVNLNTNSTTSRWFDSADFTSSKADTMQSSINSNCVTAIQQIACKA